VHIIQRYVFAELTKVFVAAFLVTALVLTMGGTLRYFERQEATAGMLVRLVPMLVAAVLPYIFPVAILLATTLVYGRMAADNELLALRAAGVHLWSVTTPALLVGLLASAASLYLSGWYIPRSHMRMRAMVLRHAPELLDRQLRQTQLSLGRVSIVHQGKEGNILKDIAITEYGDDGSPRFSISAEKASFLVDQKQGAIIFTLSNGSATFFGTDKQHGEQPTTFQRWDERLPLDWLKRSKTEIRNLPTPELWVYSRSLQGADRRKAEAEATERSALSLACFAFVFVGVPLGIRTRSRHLLSAFALACLPVYVLYFPLLIVGGQAAERGWGPVGPLLWFPDALLLVLGTVLLAIEFRR
jgi:lipopolysaccharide export system permease protein